MNYFCSLFCRTSSLRPLKSAPLALSMAKAAASCISQHGHTTPSSRSHTTRQPRAGPLPTLESISTNARPTGLPRLVGIRTSTTTPYLIGYGTPMQSLARVQIRGRVDIAPGQSPHTYCSNVCFRSSCVVSNGMLSTNTVWSATPPWPAPSGRSPSTLCCGACCRTGGLD